MNDREFRDQIVLAYLQVGSTLSIEALFSEADKFVAHRNLITKEENVIKREKLASREKARQKNQPSTKDRASTLAALAKSSDAPSA